jgi:hypothetical protein
LASHGHALGSAASKCPFAMATSFMATSARTASSVTSPLGQAGGAEAATPHLWLAAGVSGQDVPGRLVPGLRKLNNLDEFFVELAHEMPHELGLKKKWV